jgi:hypothetical protein
MSAADWEDIKEEICTELLLGKENGEAELETVLARVLGQQRPMAMTLKFGEKEAWYVDRQLGSSTGQKSSRSQGIRRNGNRTMSATP